FVEERSMMRIPKTTERRTALLHMRRLNALLASFLLLVSMNPALAHGAHGTPGAQPGLSGNHQHGHAFGHNCFNNVTVNPFVASAFTPAHNAHIPGISGGAGLPGHGYDLDLTSAVANIILGTKLFHGAPTLTVTLGATTRSFHAGDKVTAAE